MADDNISIKDAVTSTTLMGIGMGALSLGIGMIAYGGDMVRGVVVAAIGAVVLLIKYKTGY